MAATVDDPLTCGKPASPRALLRQSAGYGIGVIAIRAAPLLLVPALTRLLSPEQFGLIDLDTSLVAVLAVMAGLGLDGASFRLYYDAPDDQHRRDVLATAVLLQLLVGAVLTGLLVTSAPLWADGLTGHGGQTGDVRLAVAAMPAIVAMTSITVSLRVRARVVAFNLVAAAQTILTVAAVILALAIAPRREGTVLVAMAIAATLSAGIALVACRDLLRGHFDARTARRLVAYGLPLVPASLAVWALPLVGRLAVSHLRGANDLALLGLALKVAALLGLVVAAFQMAWGAFALSIAERPDAPRIYEKVFLGLMLGVSTVAVGLAVLARPALVLAGTPAYADAAPLVGWLLVGGVFAAATQVTNIGAVVTRRSDLTAAATVASLAICIVISIPLVALIGVEGAAAASALAMAAGAWLPVRLTRRLFPVAFTLRPILPLLVGGAVLIGLGGRPGVTGPLTALCLGSLTAAYLAAAVLSARHIGLISGRRRTWLTGGQSGATSTTPDGSLTRYTPIR